MEKIEKFFSDKEYEEELARQKNVRRKCEKILRKNYNPQGVTLTKNDYSSLLKSVDCGDKIAEGILHEKITYHAFDLVADMFVKGEIDGDFEDTLQETFLSVQKNMAHVVKKTFKGLNGALRDLIEKTNKNSTEIFGQRVPLAEVDKDFQKDPMETIFKNDQNRVLKKAFLNPKLKDREREILEGVYFDDKRRVDLAKDFRITKQAVYIYEQHALSQLRKSSDKELVDIL